MAISLRIRTMWPLLLAVSVVLGAMGWVSHQQDQKELDTQFSESLNGAVNRIAIGAAEPLWELSINVIQRLIESEATARSVEAIFVFDDKDTISAETRKVGSGALASAEVTDSKRWPFIERDIIRVAPEGNQTIGKVRVSYSRDEIERLSRESITRQIIQVIVVDLVIAILIYFSVGLISQQIRRVSETTKRIADGDFDMKIDEVERQDEIGTLMRSVEVLRANSKAQRMLQKKEKDLLVRMSITATRVGESADAIRTASSEIAQGSNDLATRTERQASALQETVSAMGDISATVAENVKNSDQARDFAAEALVQAEKGGAAVSDVIKSMSRIEGSSTRISAIIQVMEEIAFQTKLLALNAAVEAARAGELGKGFAVVAQEVRSLADRSRHASQQISDLISSSTREVEQGVQLAERAGGSLDEIVETVRKIAEIAPTIAAGSREQALSISEITKTLAELDTATQQNAALVEQSSASATSLADQVIQLVDTISDFRSGTRVPNAAPAGADPLGI